MTTVIKPLVLVPLIAVAFAGASLGFIVQRQLVPPPPEGERVRVSVVALKVTPEPTPSPTPTEEPEEPVRSGSSRGGSSGSRSNGVSGCPAGCTCETRPPQGIVIVCR